MSCKCCTQVYYSMLLKQEISCCRKYHKATLIFWLPGIATYHLRNKGCTK